MRGIEHRSVESVMNAYNLMNKPTWALFSGRDIMIPYEGDNLDEGGTLLQNYLDMLQQGGSSTVYTLKLYNNGTTNISSKTPEHASTTMMLSGAPVKTENGVTIIDRQQQGSGSFMNNQLYQQMQQRIDSLEADKNRLTQQLHEKSMLMITKDFEHKISGTAAQEKHPFDRLIEHFADNPEKIGTTLKNIIEPIGDIFSKGPKNHIINSTEEEPAINGTSNNSSTMEEEHIIINREPGEEEEEDIENSEDLTEEEEKLLDDQEHYLDYIEAETDIARTTEMLQALAAICKRIGGDKLFQMVTTVAALNDKDLNKLLNHLD